MSQVEDMQSSFLSDSTEIMFEMLLDMASGDEQETEKTDVPTSEDGHFGNDFGKVGDTDACEDAVSSAIESLIVFVSSVWAAMKRFPPALAALTRSSGKLAQSTLELCYTIGQPPRRITPSTVDRPTLTRVYWATLFCHIFGILSVGLCGCAFWWAPASDMLDTDITLTQQEVSRPEKLLMLAVLAVSGGLLCRAHESQHALPSALLVAM